MDVHDCSCILNSQMTQIIESFHNSSYDYCPVNFKSS